MRGIAWIELSKQQQQTNWASPNLTQKQLEYAASDVYYLIEIYHHLEEMMSYRPLYLLERPSMKSMISLKNSSGFGSDSGPWIW